MKLLNENMIPCSHEPFEVDYKVMLAYVCGLFNGVARIELLLLLIFSCDYEVINL